MEKTTKKMEEIFRQATNNKKIDPIMAKNHSIILEASVYAICYALRPFIQQEKQAMNRSL